MDCCKSICYCSKYDSDSGKSSLSILISSRFSSGILNQFMERCDQGPRRDNLQYIRRTPYVLIRWTDYMQSVVKISVPRMISIGMIIIRQHYTQWQVLNSGKLNRYKQFIIQNVLSCCFCDLFAQHTMRNHACLSN